MVTTYEYIDKASIDTELICSICHSPYNDPRQTPCDETFCLKCITNWIQTQTGSCPACREPLSIDNLLQTSRIVRNMLDRLRVKCLVCGQTDIQRRNFNDHIQKVCPKSVVFCPSADIKCPWTGQRDQLDQHLPGCHFEPMRSVITQFMDEIEQLKDQLNQQNTQIAEQQYEIRQLKEQVNQQISGYQNENEQQKDLVNHQTTVQQNENQQLIEQINQQRTQINTLQNENQQLIEQVVQLKTQINTFQHENQQLIEQINQQRTQINTLQSENQHLKEQVPKLKTQLNTFQRENQQLKDQINQQKTEINTLQNENERLTVQVVQLKRQLNTFQRDDQQIRPKGRQITSISSQSQKRQVPAAASLQTELNCGGDICRICGKCCDWYRDELHYVKHDNAACCISHGLDYLSFHVCQCQDVEGK